MYLIRLPTQFSRCLYGANRTNRQLTALQAALARVEALIPTEKAQRIAVAGGADALVQGQAGVRVGQVVVRDQRGQVQVGATKIPSQSALAKSDGWVVTSCVDRSEAILTDKAGQPVTPAPQPRLSHESTVQLVGANLQITKDEVLGSC